MVTRTVIESIGETSTEALHQHALHLYRLGINHQSTV